MTVSAMNVVLREIFESDASAIALLLEDGRVAETTSTIPLAYSRVHAEDWIAAVKRQSGQRVDLAIVGDCAGSPLVGVVSCAPTLADSRVGNVAYWVGPLYWDRGVATQSVDILLRTLKERGHFTPQPRRPPAPH